MRSNNNEDLSSRKNCRDLRQNSQRREFGNAGKSSQRFYPDLGHSINPLDNNLFNDSLFYSVEIGLKRSPTTNHLTFYSLLERITVLYYVCLYVCTPLRLHHPSSYYIVPNYIFKYLTPQQMHVIIKIEKFAKKNVF